MKKLTQNLLWGLLAIVVALFFAFPDRASILLPHSQTISVPPSLIRISSQALILPNLGQYPPEVLFVAQQRSLTLWFTADTIWFSLVYSEPVQARAEQERPRKFPPLTSNSKTVRWKLSFIESNPPSCLSY